MSAPTPPRAHVLVVDDEKHQRESLQMILEDEGYRVTVAADGREALARAERDRAGAQARLDAVSGGAGGKLASKRGGGFSVVVLVLVALLAFAAGHFLARGLPALKK